MNCTQRSASRGFCTALALAFFLSAGATDSSAGLMTSVPSITIKIEGVPNPQTWSYTPDASAYRLMTNGGGYELAAQPEFDILSNRAHLVIGALEFDPDPFVLNNILVKNTTESTQIFSAFVGLPTTFGAPNLISGNITTSVIDGGTDGATVATVSPTAIYQAQIDGVTVSTLQNDPFSLVAPPTGSNSASASFGPTVSAIPVNSNIGIQLRFSLTPGDTAAILSRFDVVEVPEPASAGFIGLGLALITRLAGRPRRRCDAMA
jgi:hypothetical protein